jgi:hypothetical protein
MTTATAAGGSLARIVAALSACLMLYGRIVAAARQVCPSSDTRNLTWLAAQRACEAKAVAQAVQQVNSPKLAATYMAHTRQG